MHFCILCYTLWNLSIILPFKWEEWACAEWLQAPLQRQALLTCISYQNFQQAVFILGILIQGTPTLQCISGREHGLTFSLITWFYTLPNLYFIWNSAFLATSGSQYPLYNLILVNGQGNQQDALHNSIHTWHCLFVLLRHYFSTIQYRWIKAPCHSSSPRQLFSHPMCDGIWLSISIISCESHPDGVSGLRVHSDLDKLWAKCSLVPTTAAMNKGPRGQLHICWAGPAVSLLWFGRWSLMKTWTSSMDSFNNCLPSSYASMYYPEIQSITSILQ